MYKMMEGKTGSTLFPREEGRKKTVKNNKQELPNKQRWGRGKRKMQKGRTQKAKKKQEVLEAGPLLDITYISNQ